MVDDRSGCSRWKSEAGRVNIPTKHKSLGFSPRLLCFSDAGWLIFYRDDPDLGILLVPALGDVVEDEAELACFARLDGGGRYRFCIHVGLAGADEAERHRLFLGEDVGVVAKGYLHGDAGERFVSVVGDGAVEIGQLCPGHAGGFAHLEVGERQAGGIGIGRGQSGSPWITWLFVAATEEQEYAYYDKNHGPGGDPRGYGTRLFGLIAVGVQEAGILRIAGCHQRDFTSRTARPAARASRRTSGVKIFQQPESRFFHFRNLLGLFPRTQRFSIVEWITCANIFADFAPYRFTMCLKK